MESWTEFLARRRQSPPTTEKRPYIARVIKAHDVHIIKAKDHTGRRACYFVYVPPRRAAMFLEALKKTEVIDLCDYGEILACNYGEQPTEQTKQLLREKYGLEV